MTGEQHLYQGSTFLHCTVADYKIQEKDKQLSGIFHSLCGNFRETTEQEIN